MATDSEILASLATSIGAVDAAAGGPFSFMGYDPILNKMFMADEHGTIFSMNPDGTSIVDTGAFAGWSTSVAPASGKIVGNFWAAGVQGYNVKGYHTLFNMNLDLSNFGSSTRYGVYSKYDDVHKRVYVVWSNDYLGVMDMTDSSGAGSGPTEDTFEGTFSNLGRIALAPNKELSDTSTGAIFGVSTSLIKMWSMDNHVNGASDELNSWDLTSGSFPGTFGDVVDLEYSEDEDLLYLMLDEGSDVVKIYAVPATEESTVADFFEVGTVDGDAEHPTTSMALVLDEYDSLPVVADIPNLVLHLDAATALDAGAATPDNDEAVASWPDSSAAGNDPTTIAGPIYKTSVLNSLPGVYFDGVDDYIQLPDGTVEWPMTAFLVIDSDASSDGYIFFAGLLNAGVTATLGLRMRSGDELQFFNGNALIDPNVSYDPAGDVAVFGQLSTAVPYGSYTRYFAASAALGSGGIINSTTVPTTADMNTPQILGARVDGSLPTLSFPWEGVLLELKIYNRELTPLEMYAVQQDLKTKYAL